MRVTGKLDYLEMPAANGSLDTTKSFYARAFGWSFTDYGPTYSAFAEGLDGGFDADGDAIAKPLPYFIPPGWKILCWQSRKQAAPSSSLSFPFPAGGASISSIRREMSSPSGATGRFAPRIRSAGLLRDRMAARRGSTAASRSSLGIAIAASDDVFDSDTQ